VVSTIAGTCTSGANPCTAGYADGTPGMLDHPEGIAFGPSKTLFIADTQNHRIRATRLP